MFSGFVPRENAAPQSFRPIGQIRATQVPNARQCRRPTPSLPTCSPIAKHLHAGQLAGACFCRRYGARISVIWASISAAGFVNLMDQPVQQISRMALNFCFNTTFFARTRSAEPFGNGRSLTTFASAIDGIRSKTRMASRFIFPSSV
jgi:hypothetical protein